MKLNNIQNGSEQTGTFSDETLKKASLYQVIEELILAEHARFLTEDCGIDLDKPIQVEDPEGKKDGEIGS
jgi:hypothetical protein